MKFIADDRLHEWQDVKFRYYEHARHALLPRSIYVRPIFRGVYADRFPNLSNAIIDMALEGKPRESVTAVVLVLQRKISEWWKREAIISRNKQRAFARACKEATRGGCTDPFYINGISPETFGETCRSMAQVAHDIESTIGLDDEPVPPMPSDKI